MATPTNASDMFTAVDESEIPVSAKTGRRGSMYDELVDAAFEVPGNWYRINKDFASPASAQGIRKRYKDLTDDDGNILHVKSAKSGDKIFTIYVKADQPK